MGNYVIRASKGEPTCILCLGNPGAGKSTILNSMIGRAEFLSGFSLGIGMTNKMDKITHNGLLYIDTPGLADPQMREAAANSIYESLTRKLPYKMIFVLTLEGADLRSQDQATIELILEALEGQVGANEYGVIVNKVPDYYAAESKTTVKDYFSKGDSKDNNGNIPFTDKIVWLKEDPSCKDADGMILQFPLKFWDFVNNIPSVLILPHKVKRIDWNKYDRIVNEIELVQEKNEEKLHENNKLEIKLGEKPAKDDIEESSSVTTKKEEAFIPPPLPSHTFKVNDKVIVLKDIDINYGESLIKAYSSGTVVDADKYKLIISFDGEEKHIPEYEYNNIISDNDWPEDTVKNLAHRGITLSDLLEFYYKLGNDLFPNFEASHHTTEDVVRHAILAETIKGEIAYAEKCDEGKLAERMVSHSWSNTTFNHLVAAIIADATNHPTYEKFSDKLCRLKLPELKKDLVKYGGNPLEVVYWICPFSVNQHRSICKSKYFTKGAPKCKCDSKNYDNDHPLCEVDKFDRMFQHLVNENIRRGKEARHLVVIDKMCKIFTRVWVLAEIVQADYLGTYNVTQKLCAFNVASVKGLLEKEVDIKKSESTNPQDKETIIEKTKKLLLSTDAFNKRLNEKIKILVEDNMKEAAKVHILCIGNSHVGTRSILKSMINDPTFKFEDKVKLGLCEFEHNGKVYMEVPGLDNPRQRKMIAKLINSAFKKVGMYKIFFIVTLENGRVRPQDTETISSINEVVKIGNKCTIIINKASNRIINELTKPDSLAMLRKTLLPKEMLPGSIHCVAEKTHNKKGGFQSLEGIVDSAPSIKLKGDICPISEYTPEESLKIEKKIFSDLDLQNRKLKSMLQEGTVPYSRRGLSLRQLKALRSGLIDTGWLQAYCDKFNNEHALEIQNGNKFAMSTNLYAIDVAFTKPVTQAASLSRRDIPSEVLNVAGIPLAPQANVCLAQLLNPDGLVVDYCVSHAWLHPFERTVQSLTNFAQGVYKDIGKSSPDDVVFWVCFLSLNQHHAQFEVGEEPNQAPFGIALSNVKHGCASVIDGNVEPLKRTWCLYDIYQAKLFRKSYEFITDDGRLANTAPEILEEISENILHFRASESHASSELDKLKILHEVIDKSYKNRFPTFESFKSYLEKFGVKDFFFTEFDAYVCSFNATPFMEAGLKSRSASMCLRAMGMGATVTVDSFEYLTEGLGVKLNTKVSTNFAGTCSLAIVFAFMGQAEELEYLLHNDVAEVDETDSEGRTSLYWAAQRGHANICGILLVRGASINSKSNYGFTTLHIAAQCGHLNVCTLLLNHGADIRAKNRSDETPCMLAVKGEHSDVCARLQSD